MKSWERPSAQSGATTSFGLCLKSDPVAVTFMERWANHLNPEKSTRLARLDQQLLRVSGRWTPGGEDPATLVPGDYGPIRAIVAGSMLNELAALSRLLRDLGRVDDPETRKHLELNATGLAAQIALMHEAVPFYVDAETAVGLLGSHPPDRETMTQVQLPFPVVAVFFGAEMEFPDETVWPDEYAQEVERIRSEPNLRQGLPWSSFALDIGQALWERGGKITGLIASQDPQGSGIADVVCWMVSAEPDPRVDALMQNDRQRSLLITRRSQAEWGSLVDNVLASVSWMPWKQARPVDLPDDVDSKEWRKAANKGAFRKGEPRGGVLGVHVIDMATHNHEREQNRGPVETGRTVTAHLRRGHWRRSRVGPRSDWHYEARWVNPVVVNPGAQADQKLRVYRVPVPPTDPAPA